MLSNPHSNLHQRQRQHRRQNSTPTAFDAPKVPLLPATTFQRHGSHRRGLSLDQRNGHQQQQQRRQSQQDDRTVSTNHGLQQNQQHILQETQQQRLARPGQQQQRHNHISQGQHISTQSHHSFDNCFEHSSGLNNDIHSSDQRFSLTDLNNNKGSGNQSGNGTRDVPFLSTFESTTPAGYLDGFELGFHENTGVSQNEGDVGGPLTVRQKVTNYEALNDRKRHSLRSDYQLYGQRPSTPPNQWSHGHYPLTPATTPFRRAPKSEHAQHRTVHLSPTRDVDQTIKASHSHAMKRGTSCMEFFAECSFDTDANGLPSPPNTAPLMPSSTFDMAPMPSPSFLTRSGLKMEFPRADNGYESSYYSPMSSALSPSASSQRSSPELADMPLFEDPLANMASFPNRNGINVLPSSNSAMELSSVTSSINTPFSPRAMSISELNLDATVEDTGITIDDIASFISGPDPIDGKWVCLFPECNKKFGRKENIKSHVQTHLGDRQYRCIHCKKCFVRQHDLKRHAKIHSGVKPYPCLCGNSFARHDALTRHRQRGMCIGAFEGVVKKVVKRGRPKKHRPETEERLDKAERTRKRAIAKSYASSASGSSESSWLQSPPATYETLSRRGSSPLDTLPALQSDSYALSSDIFTYTPPTSPGQTQELYLSPHHIGQAHSPIAYSSSPSPKRGSITSIPEESLPLPSNHTSPSKSTSSQYGTPPELCLESSSPPASAFFDFDETLDVGVNDLITGNTPSGGSTSELDLPDISEHAEEMFLGSFGADTGITALERDPSMLLMDKFEDPFNTDDLFSDNYAGSDVFFGSP
ncbi:MAG: hypothetical protein M1827_000037 [Pycnora praestabilis]|nr:MAG: hypothetical protein M1827_000037 [Pycnora praestabilis]